MKFLAAIVLTSLVSFALGLYLPWWSVALAAFLVCLIIPLRPLMGFLSGFVGIFLLWLLIAAVRNADNNGILSAKIATIFPLGGSALLLMIVGSFMGAIVGGFAALSACYLRKIYR